MTLSRRLAAEALGSAMLLAMVVGSAIMAGRLAGGNVAIALLANGIASATGLLALVLAFGGISGAHFNPAITVAEAWQGKLPWRDAAPYCAAQVIGAFAGVAAAHAMFGEPVFSAAVQARTGPSMWWSEFLATFGLVAVTSGCSLRRPSFTPFAAAAYIASAYWFTASSSFANPALTLARAASRTVAGIRLDDVSGYAAAQLLGATAAAIVITWLHSPTVPAPAESAAGLPVGRSMPP